MTPHYPAKFMNTPHHNPQNPSNALDVFFEPKTLTDLAVQGNILTFSVHYEAIEFEKTGFLALARKLPLLKSMTPFRSKSLGMDIDLSCAVLDDNHQVLDKVWYGHVRGLNESIRYVGGLCGANNFEETLAPQESISVRLQELPSNAKWLIFVISSYHKHPLAHAKKGVARLTDNEHRLIHDFEFDGTPADEYGMVAWVIERYGEEFRISTPKKVLGQDFNPTDLNSELDKLQFFN